MNALERRRYWLQYARQQRLIEVEFVPKVQNVLKKQISSFITEAERVGWQQAYTSLPPINEEMIAVLTSLYRKEARVFGPQVNRMLTKGLTDLIQKVIDFLLIEGFNLIARIDANTKDELIKIIHDNRALSFRDLVNLIEDHWIIGIARSTVIVRTESTRAANMTMHHVAETGKWVTNKIWVSKRDDRVRRYSKKAEFDHWLMDGIQIPVSEKFSQLGSKGRIAEADFPGDPKAPPGFTANCRCVLKFETVKDNRGRSISKR